MRRRWSVEFPSRRSDRFGLTFHGRRHHLHRSGGKRQVPRNRPHRTITGQLETSQHRRRPRCRGCLVASRRELGAPADFWWREARPFISMCRRAQPGRGWPFQVGIDDHRAGVLFSSRLVKTAAIHRRRPSPGAALPIGGIGRGESAGRPTGRDQDDCGSPSATARTSSKTSVEREIRNEIQIEFVTDACNPAPAPNPNPEAVAARPHLIGYRESAVRQTCQKGSADASSDVRDRAWSNTTALNALRPLKHRVRLARHFMSAKAGLCVVWS